jgi:hypothetical protein
VALRFRVVDGRVILTKCMTEDDPDCRQGYNAGIVPYLPDLSAKTAKTPNLKNIGFLWSGHSFPRGRVSPLLFERLVSLVEMPRRSCASGYHNCCVGLCRLRIGPCPQHTFQFRGRILYLGSWNIIVPAMEQVFIAPNLILHYLHRHKYKPPETFCSAVLDCPTPGSEAYFASIRRIAPDSADYL